MLCVKCNTLIELRVYTVQCIQTVQTELFECRPWSDVGQDHCARPQPRHRHRHPHGGRVRPRVRGQLQGGRAHPGGSLQQHPDRGHDLQDGQGLLLLVRHAGAACPVSAIAGWLTNLCLQSRDNKITDRKGLHSKSCIVKLNF